MIRSTRADSSARKPAGPAERRASRAATASAAPFPRGGPAPAEVEAMAAPLAVVPGGNRGPGLGIEIGVVSPARLTDC
jgi:hypothetical protein